MSGRRVTRGPAQRQASQRAPKVGPLFPIAQKRGRPNATQILGDGGGRSEGPGAAPDERDVVARDRRSMEARVRMPTPSSASGRTPLMHRQTFQMRKAELARVAVIHRPQWPSRRNRVRLHQWRGSNLGTSRVRWGSIGSRCLDPVDGKMKRCCRLGRYSSEAPCGVKLSSAN